MHILMHTSTQTPAPHGCLELGLFCFRVVAQIDGLGTLLVLITAPRLAVEPFLRQRLDRYLMDHVIGQVLIEIR